MIIDCVGCLHGNLPKLEGGDLLIVTGDLTDRDHLTIAWIIFEKWVGDQNYKKKIIISGNHDNTLQSNGYDLIYKDWKRLGFTYLCDSGTEFEGLKIWGSPWTPWFHGVNPKCKAFMKSDNKLSKHWDKIPKGTDILITHGPAFGILDGIPLQDGSLYHAGSKSLYGWLNYVERPKLHVFSHIHEGYGVEEYFSTYDYKMMKSVNCSHVNQDYKPINNPIRVIL